MITFYGKVYNVTSDEWVDNSFRQYSIAVYIGAWTQYENPFVTHEGSQVTTIPATDYSFETGSNIGTIIEYAAKEYYNRHQVWPVIRIYSSDETDDYYIEWAHSSPNSLLVCAQGVATSWRSCYQWSDTIDASGEVPRYNTLYSQVFVTANSISALEESAVVFGGAFNIQESSVTSLIAYTQLNVSAPPGAVIDQANQLLLTTRAYGSTYKQYKRNAGPAIALYWDADANTVRYWLFAPNVSGHILPPWNVDMTPGGIPASATFGGINFNAYGNGFGYTSPPYVASAGLKIGYTGNNLSEALAAAGIAVSYDKNQLYQYLTPPNPPTPPTPPGPDPSDVDPDNPPDPDDPPDPIPPDDTDPYYDPTSDPDNPDYDPTKDPDSPDYDPTDPHTPYRPPSGPSDTPQQEEHPPVDPVPTPETPSSYVTTNAMFTLYNPSGGDLTSLANFLWSSTWSIDTFKKIFANPLDCILGLMVMPHLSAAVDTKVMNVGNISTGVTMHYFTKQFYDFDCGTFDLMEYYNSYLDYSPYTKVNIFLPYIGDKQLSTDEVMNKTLGVKYRFDIATGDCIAFITVNGTVLYSFSGNCAARLPLAGNNWNGIIPAITGVAISAGSMAAGMPALGAASAAAVSTMKETISHTGSISGSAGLMGIQTPYLIVTRPRQALPLGQNSFTGYPSFITESLGSLTGYTEVEQCHLEHVPATGAELEEIERLLKEGVLF